MCSAPGTKRPPVPSFRIEDILKCENSTKGCSAPSSPELCNKAMRSGVPCPVILEESYQPLPSSPPFMYYMADEYSLYPGTMGNSRPYYDPYALPYTAGFGMYGGGITWNRCQANGQFLGTQWSFQGIPHVSGKRKGGQVRFTPLQTQNLEKRFGSHKYLSPEDRKLLASQLKLSDRQVKTWFQNRRAKWRRINNIPKGEESEESPSDEDASSVSSHRGASIVVG